MRHIVFVLIVFLNINQLYSQGFQLLLDPINSAQSSSLFNLSVVNQNNYSSRIELKATLRSGKGKLLSIQQLFSEINANEIKGFRGNNLNPQILYMDPSFERLYNEGNGLPPMDYALCVQLIVHADPPVKVEECNNYKSSDFINLIPVYPNNKDVIYENRPMFHWLDLSGLQDCDYELKLVKYKAKTNPNSALRRDLPVFQIKDIPVTQLSYPLDADALEDGQSYVWQVTLNCYGERIISTDAWVFTYKEKDTLVDIPRNLSYVDINEAERGAMLYAVGEFKFKYTSKNNSELKVRLFENFKKEGKNNEIKLKENTFDVGTGFNAFKLDLKDQVHLKHLKEYRLQLETKEGDSYRYLIKFINPEYIQR